MSEQLQYLTNGKGKKTAVVLPLQDYEKLLEDMDDLAVMAERRDEPTIPHEEFKKGLKRPAATVDRIIEAVEELSRNPLPSGVDS
jgi:hypothetical protein